MADNKSRGAVLRKILLRVRRYWPAMILSLVMATVYVAMTLYIPILAGQAIDCCIDMGRVDFMSVGRTLTAILVCAGVAALSQWIMNEMNNRVTYRVTRDVRDEAFRHIQVLPLSYLDKHPQGDTVSRIISDVDTFADGLLMGFTQLFTGVATIIGTLGFMLALNFKITIVVVCITPVSLFVASFIAKRTFSMFKLQSSTRGEQTAIIDEMIGNQKVVQAFNQEDEALEKFDEVNERLHKYSLRAIFFSSIIPIPKPSACLFTSSK